jgi:hypothetical protein
MQNIREQDRVLNRLGARLLAPEELTEVRGGIIHTGVCTFDPRTDTVDGDCTPEPNFR